MSEFETQDLRFIRVKPRQLSRARWAEIIALRNRAYARTMPGRSQTERDYFVGTTTKRSWDNPNKAVDQNPGQIRARTEVVAAVDKNDKLAGYIYTANNTSSTRDGITGTAERIAKLKIPAGRFLGSRYRWIREIINGDQRHGLEAVLGSLSLETCLYEQPVSCFPYSDEPELMGVLDEWGLHPTDDPSKLIRVFGPEARPTAQTRWVAEHAGQVRANIAALDGAERAIREAHAPYTY